MGALLVLTGIAFLTGSINQMSVWLLEAFPVLGQDRLARPQKKAPAFPPGPFSSDGEPPTSSWCSRSPGTRRR